MGRNRQRVRPGPMASEAVCVIGQVHDLVLQRVEAMLGDEVGFAAVLP